MTMIASTNATAMTVKMTTSPAITLAEDMATYMNHPDAAFRSRAPAGTTAVVAVTKLSTTNVLRC
jgi:hypothetical protein